MQLCASARLSAAVVLRPRAVQYRRVTKMSADAPLKKYKLDASSEGCTGECNPSRSPIVLILVFHETE